MEELVIAARNASDPIVAMPPRAASIYMYMLFALSALWFVGFVYIATYVLRCRSSFLESVPIPNALTAALHGVSDLPVAVRFSKDQGSRWVTVCLFGMTVTSLFNVAGVLLFGNVSLGGPEGLFYFYAYFLIFIAMGIYFWPIFVSHTLVHRQRGRVYGILYSGLVLCTVFLSSVYNDQSRVYALVLNAPYMICGTLVFVYFVGAFTFYRPPPIPPGQEKTWKNRFRPMPLDKNFFDFEKSYVRRLLTPLQKEHKLEERENKLQQQQENEDITEMQQEIMAETNVLSKAYGGFRRMAIKFGNWIGNSLSALFNRLVFGSQQTMCRFSTRLLTGLLMNLMMVYETAIFLDFQAVVLLEPYLDTDVSEEVEALIWGTTVAATSLAFIIIAFQALLTLKTFRVHLTQLRKGDYSFIPGGRKKLNYDLNDTCGFVGFQTGYGFIGFFFIFIIAELLMVFIWAIAYIESVRNFVVQVLVKQLLFLPLLSVMIFIQVQKLIVRLVFLRKNVGDETGGTDGQFYTPYFNSFSHYEYFMTFVSTMRGFISYLYSRLLTPFGFMFLFSTRLDRCAVVQGWESMDEGYRSYIGVLLADHHYNNPINLIFLLHVSELIDERRALAHEEQADDRGSAVSSSPLLPVVGMNVALVVPDNISDDHTTVRINSGWTDNGSGVNDMQEPLLPTEKSMATVVGEASVVLSTHIAPSHRDGSRRRLLRNRWWLAITLTSNPQLIALRKHNLVKVEIE